MKLNKQQKKEKSKELSKKLQSAEAVFFTSFQGLKFTDIESLRKKLSSLKCKFSVVKNSITGHALKNAYDKNLPKECFLKGPVAMALLEKGDFVSIAKALAQFGKQYSALKMKAGYLENKWFDEKECVSLSRLSTRKDNLAHLACSLNACISNIASVMNAPIRDLAFALKALEEKKQTALPAK